MTLSSTEQGEAKIEALAANMTVTDPASILWRVVAMNNPTGRTELTEGLSAAKAKKDTVLNASNAVEVSAALDRMSTLTGLYAAVADKAQERAVTLPKVDKLMMTAGDALFAQFRVAHVSDFLGEKILQNIFLARAQIDEADRQRLLEAQADYGLANRTAIRQGAETSHSLQEMETAAAKSPNRFSA